MVPSSLNHLLVILLKANIFFQCDLNFSITWGGGGGVGAVIMRCQKSKSFVYGAE